MNKNRICNGIKRYLYLFLYFVLMSVIMYFFKYKELCKSLEAATFIVGEIYIIISITEVYKTFKRVKFNIRYVQKSVIIVAFMECVFIFTIFYFVLSHYLFFVSYTFLIILFLLLLIIDFLYSILK